MFLWRNLGAGGPLPAPPFPQSEASPPNSTNVNTPHTVLRDLEIPWVLFSNYVPREFICLQFFYMFSCYAIHKLNSYTIYYTTYIEYFESVALKSCKGIHKKYLTVKLWRDCLLSRPNWLLHNYHTRAVAKLLAFKGD